MARSEKTADGKTVRVDTPEYGCKTVEHGAKPKAKPVTTDEPKGDK